MGKFKFSLGEKVTITASGETGTVIGQAHYLESADCFFVRYKAADGRAVEAWWNEGALSK